MSTDFRGATNRLDDQE